MPPPVETVSETSGKKRRLKFLRNTAYEGKDYGPGMPAGDTAEVDARWAIAFLQNGRAVEANGGEGDTGDGDADDGDEDESKKKSPAAK
jgi:hypothetical protein